MTGLASITRHRLFWPVTALLVLVLANVVRSPSFLAVKLINGNLYGAPIDIVRNGSPLLLIALGMTLVIATRGIDLSVGSVVAISGALALTIIADSGNPGSVAVVVKAVLAALALAVLLGLWNGALVALVGVQPIVATLILMTAGRGIAMLITNGQITTVTSAPYKQFGAGFVFGIPVAVILAGLVFCLMLLATHRTALGVLIESVGINPEASRLSGVRATSLRLTVYTLCAVLSALAGIMLSANVMAADANNAGLFIEMDAILAVVIGGTSLAGGRFSLVGTAVGVLVIQTLTLSVTTLGIPPAVTPLFKALVVIVICLAQSPALRRRLQSRTPVVATVAPEVSK